MTEHSKIGAAILGLYAAIKICRDEDYDWLEVANLVENECFGECSDELSK